MLEILGNVAPRVRESNNDWDESQAYHRKQAADAAHKWLGFTGGIRSILVHARRSDQQKVFESPHLATENTGEQQVDCTRGWYLE